MTMQKHCHMYIDHGRYLDLYHPDPAMFALQDIAWSLLEQTRWTGRSNISVLQHSLNVASLLPDHLKLQGLMHDAAEAFTGDIHTPLKKCLPELVEIEEALNTALAARFGYLSPFAEEVHEADRLVGSLEAQQVFVVPYEPPPECHAEAPLDETLYVFRDFMREFKQYGGKP